MVVSGEINLRMMKAKSAYDNLEQVWSRRDVGLAVIVKPRLFELRMFDNRAILLLSPKN